LLVKVIPVCQPHSDESELSPMKAELPTLEQWNLFTLSLVQAMLGAISPNFRMVAVSNTAGVWHLLFVLESEDEQDREEIADIATEVEALQDAAIRYKLEIRVTSEPFTLPGPPARVVYQRRES
jgi:hypothetical protein